MTSPRARHLLALLGLLAALAGTPLRLAEAAVDQARVLEAEDDAEIEQVDGGVGDDTEVALKAAAPDVLLDLHPLAGGWAALAVAPVVVQCFTPRECPVPARWPGSKSPGRLAWLQCYRC